jgi:hypothetical protein
MPELVQIGVEGGTRQRRAASPSIQFCSNCGELFAEALEERVCPECGLGVVLSSAAEALPGRAAAFLLVDRDFGVRAVSVAGERLVGDATGQPLSSLIKGPNGELSRQVARAASGMSGTARIGVNVLGRRGPFEARVSPCGPPRAALVVLSRVGEN